MTGADWGSLRRPFESDEIELLPRYTGKKDESGRPPKDSFRRCGECGRYHAFPCVHLRYVGHAGITERLNECDPEWNWEPAALDANGLPLMSNGGMWIKLTVFGVTRWGFGDAQGKTGPNAVKEIIGDAIRNAAMRFGVGTYLWSKSERAERMVDFSGHEEDVDGEATNNAAEFIPEPLKEARMRLVSAERTYAESHGMTFDAVHAGTMKRPDYDADSIDALDAIATEFEEAA